MWLGTHARFAKSLVPPNKRQPHIVPKVELAPTATAEAPSLVVSLSQVILAPFVKVMALSSSGSPRGSQFHGKIILCLSGINSPDHFLFSPLWRELLM